MTRPRENESVEGRERFIPDDDLEAQMDEPALDFNDDEPTDLIGERLPYAEVEQQQSPQRAREAGLTEAALPGHGPTADDLSPETLIPDDGSNSPSDYGRGRPTDQTFSRVNADEIGGGNGLDEAELARVDPLDGKPWDENEKSH